MSNLKIVLLSGISNTGKSTLLNELMRRERGYALFSVDQYKETMWDREGFATEVEKQKLNKRAEERLLSDIKVTIQMTKSEIIVIEYPFHNRWGMTLRNSFRMYNPTFKTIILDYVGDEDSWVKSFTRRISEGKRHSGHQAINFSVASLINSKQNIINNAGYIFTSEKENELIEMGDTLRIQVKQEPYEMSVNIEDIIKFIER